MQTFTNRQIEIMENAIKRIDQFGIQSLTTKNLAADIGITEPALYRHFKSKNDILKSLLQYFKSEIIDRLKNILLFPKENYGDELRQVFESQLETFTNKPAIVSVIFAESIFHFDESLSAEVNQIMKLMQEFVHTNIEEGQKNKQYASLISPSILTTIIVGGMRMAVLKWKLSGHKSNLVKDGKAVLNGILKMIETNK